MKTITNQSVKWEILNSLYILPGLICCGPVSFIYIGRKVRQKKWIITGFIYFAVLLFSFANISGNSIIDIPQRIRYSIIMPTFIIFWAVSLIHLIAVRKEYLLRLEAVMEKGEDDVSRLKRKINNEYHPEPQHLSMADLTDKETTPAQPAVNVQIADQAADEIPATDVNTCSESDLEKLPGVTALLAMKLVDYRKANGGFKDEDEFFSVSALKPHFVVQLRGKIICSNNTPAADKPDRKLDF